MTKTKAALLFFVAGLAFTIAVDQLPGVACNDTCPDWFTHLVALQLAYPIIWAAVGYLSPKRLVAFATLLVLSSVASYGLQHQTAYFAKHAVGG